MNTIKEMLTNDWRAKVTCLLLASALWYLISKNVEKSPQRFDRGTSASKLLKT
jgi:YbbR domain-containing protein